MCFAKIIFMYQKSVAYMIAETGLYKAGAKFNERRCKEVLDSVRFTTPGGVSL